MKRMILTMTKISSRVACGDLLIVARLGDNMLMVLEN